MRLRTCRSPLRCQSVTPLLFNSYHFRHNAGGTSWKVWQSYMASLGWLVCALLAVCMVMGQVCYVAAQYWLATWAFRSPTSQRRPLWVSRPFNSICNEISCFESLPSYLAKQSKDQLLLFAFTMLMYLRIPYIILSTAN